MWREFSTTEREKGGENDRKGKEERIGERAGSKRGRKELEGTIMPEKRTRLVKQLSS